MKYKIKWVIFRVGETHVLSFTLHFSYMCFLCYTGWQLCMYLYVHVPVCRCHGTCMHVWRPEDSFGCWPFLSVLFAVVYPGWLVHKLLGILLSLFPRYHRSTGITDLCYCDQLLCGLLILKFRSSCWHAHRIISPVLYYMSWGQICFMSLYYFLEE